MEVHEEAFHSRADCIEERQLAYSVPQQCHGEEAVEDSGAKVRCKGSNVTHRGLGYKLMKSCRAAMQATHTAVSTQSWSPRWQSTWIQSTSLAGNLVQQLRPRMSLVLILQTTHTQPFPTRSGTCSWLSSSTTASSVRSVLARLTSLKLPTLTS